MDALRRSLGDQCSGRERDDDRKERSENRPDLQASRLHPSSTDGRHPRLRLKGAGFQLTPQRNRAP